LEGERTDQRQGQAAGRFLKDLEKVVFQVLEHKVYDAFFAEGLLQLDDVRVDGKLQ
jgi:hypothetical protein